MARRKRLFNKALYVIVSLILVNIVNIYSAFSSPTPNSPRFHKVKIWKVVPNKGVLKVPHAGTLVSARKVRVSSELGGVVERLFFEKGQRVKKGQVLAEIGTSTIKVQVEEARAAIEQARARLERLKAGPRSEEVSMAEARVDEARAGLAEAEENYARIKRLHERKVASSKELDFASRVLKVARAKLKMAQNHLELVKKGPREEEIREARAAVKRAEAALQMALDRLGKSIIRAPSSGLIAYRMVEEGELVPPGFIITEVVDDTNFKIVLKINERDLTALKEGSIYSFQVYAIGEGLFNCRLKFISPIADQRTRAFEVELKVLDTHPKMADGMSVKVLLPTKGPDNGIVVPISWLVENHGRLGLLVAEGGKARFRPVKLGNYYEREVEIREGPKVGELIITNPSGIRPGDPVVW